MPRVFSEKQLFILDMCQVYFLFKMIYHNVYWQ